jgi:hypothetical protein
MLLIDQVHRLSRSHKPRSSKTKRVFAAVAVQTIGSRGAANDDERSNAGVCQVRQNDSSNDLLARADKALYRAKDAGRNCVLIKVARVLHFARGPPCSKGRCPS